MDNKESDDEYFSKQALHKALNLISEKGTRGIDSMQAEFRINRLVIKPIILAGNLAAVRRGLDKDPSLLNASMTLTGSMFPLYCAVEANQLAITALLSIGYTSL